MEKIDTTNLSNLERESLLSLLDDQPEVMLGSLGPTEHLIVLYIITAMIMLVSIICACLWYKTAKCMKMKHKAITINNKDKIDNSNKHTNTTATKQTDSPPATDSQSVTKVSKNQ